MASHDVTGVTEKTAGDARAAALRAPPLIRPSGRDLRRGDRQRRYRQRLRDGEMTVAFQIDAEVIDLLIRSGWLSEAEADNRAAIGRAVSAMLRDSARRR
jgi:hypothetical protein